VYGDKARGQTKNAYGRLMDAHLLATGVLAAALLRVNGVISPTTSIGEQRDALFASFVIGITSCENAIEEGRYLQAAALLRQELELLAQLKAVRAGQRNENSSPNLSVIKDTVLGESLARLNGDLCAAAHASKHHVVRSMTEYEVSGDELSGPTSGTRYFPQFDENLARRFFSLHLMLIHAIIVELAVDLPEKCNGDGFTEREVEAVNLSLELVRIEGMIEIDTQGNLNY
jgi:hypothetical protein